MKYAFVKVSYRVSANSPEMIYGNTWKTMNYWVFGLSVRYSKNTREHDVSETGSVFVFG
jgi:hypothetical protein